ncbi:MAG TPA: anthranilate synthase component I family protein [Tepidisphaeraceae bacterium]|jgi:para-aminobenzoate synthetase component 1
MSVSRGRIRFESVTGRTPWHELTAHGTALVANPADPLETLAELDARTGSTRHAGYFSYELGRCFETLPTEKTDTPGLPLFAFVPVDARPEPPSFVGTLDGDKSQLISSTFTRPAYEAAVRRCLDYIAAGDVFQINLSQRLKVKVDRTPSETFAKLQRRFPAEYGALLEFDDFALVSNSPELFLRVERLSDGRRRIVNRPIKGTRPNAPGMHAELLASEKEKAELAMIVDLQRNDLGRICEVGSVIVTEPRTIEPHPTVLHGVATVEGVLRDGVTLTDILRATFPCGSITGCPKIRAMQIIDELEPVPRGAYCGAIGWIGRGEMELSVAIRTMTLRDGCAYVPVGGGIVADSDPAAEYAETLVKAKAMLTSLGVSEKELAADGRR